MTCTVDSNNSDCKGISIDPLQCSVEILATIQTKVCNHGFMKSISIQYVGKFRNQTKISKILGIDHVISPRQCQINNMTFIFDSCKAEYIWGSIGVWEMQSEFYDFNYFFVKNKAQIAPFKINYEVRCSISSTGEACQDYMGFLPDDESDCNIGLVYEFYLERNIDECMLVEKIYGSIDEESWLSIEPDNLSVEQRYLFPGKKLLLSRAENRNICNYVGKEKVFDIFVNDNVSVIRARISIPVSNYRSQIRTSQSILCIVNNMGFGILYEEYAKYLRDNVCIIDEIYKFDLINIGNECDEIKYINVCHISRSN